MYKSKKGITLIALVVTIIVLLLLAGISITMLSGQNGILTKARDAGDSTKFSNYKEKVDIYFQGKRIAAETEGTEIETTITDKAEIKKIISDITDEDLEKLSIEDGKLVYDEEKVSDGEKTLMESVGILAMSLGATIIFIANGTEFARLKSNRIKFPTEIPVPNNTTWFGGGYDFVGWYSDQELWERYRDEYETYGSLIGQEGRGT